MDQKFVEVFVGPESWGAEGGDDWWQNRRSIHRLSNPFIQQSWQKQSDQKQLTTAEPFQISTHNDAKMAAVLFCDVLGALCILLNAFVILALLRNRRRVLVNVFYVLVLHCAVVDLIRGACLIAWGMPHLLIHTMRSIDDRLFALKINQFTLVILRSCNLLTIFNLLVFTTNEFIVIKYPLHYRRYFCRRTVVFVLAIWFVSLLFGIGSVFANFLESVHNVLVEMNATVSPPFEQNEWRKAGDGEEEDEDELPPKGVTGSPFEQNEWRKAGDGEEEDEDGLPPKGPNGVQRRQMAGLSINGLFMLMIFVLCYVCLFTVLICYGKILKTIRQFQRHGGDGRRRVLTNSAVGSQKKPRNRTAGGSIYHKRSVHQQRNHHNQQKGGCQGVVGGGEQLPTEVQSSSNRMDSLSKKVSIPGTPQSRGSRTNCGRCPNCEANPETEIGRSRRCNSHRKWRSHLMSRHKYLIVIGTVLFVDILFLFPYSGIQMVALLHLNNLLATSHLTTLIRWCLQILIGVHSVCQPLCYFRMTFRRLACCLGETRRFGGSGSSAGGSIFGGATAGTISRSAKSIGTMKAPILGGNENGDTDEQPPAKTKRSIVLRTVVSQGMPPRGIMKLAEAGERQEEMTNWANPSVDGQQMLLITQRRRWRRNLSLLCKEEGEELELFLAKEYRRRGVEEHGKGESGQEESGGEEKLNLKQGEGLCRGEGSLKEEGARRKRDERQGEVERGKRRRENGTER